MIVSFSDAARVEQLFTDNRRELQRAAGGDPADQPHDLAGRGPARGRRPGQSGPQRRRDQRHAGGRGACRPTLYIFSDGKFPDVEGFSLGNLEPVFVPIGEPSAGNVGIAAFSTRRREDKPDQLQAFGRLENFGPDDVTADVELLRDGTLIDASKVELEAGRRGRRGVRAWATCTRASLKLRAALGRRAGARRRGLGRGRSAARSQGAAGHAGQRAAANWPCAPKAPRSWPTSTSPRPRCSTTQGVPAEGGGRRLRPGDLRSLPAQADAAGQHAVHRPLAAGRRRGRPAKRSARRRSSTSRRPIR